MVNSFTTTITTIIIIIIIIINNHFYCTYYKKNTLALRLSTVINYNHKNKNYWKLK